MDPPQIRLSRHGVEQLERRGLDREQVLKVAQHPEQTVPVRPGLEIRQSRLVDEERGVPYLLRVVVDLGVQQTVVTMYRTSKIDKYWIDS